MPSDDLKNYATSDTDFYELLGITFETSQRDIDRAWRKTALKYHPDKVGTDPVAKEKFHLAQIGYDLLSDPAIKVLYDNTRAARLQRKRQNELFEGRRRQLKDDLEARERGVKRGRDEEDGDEEKLEREIRRLAEDGRRRRKEREEGLRKSLQRDTGPSNVSAAGEAMASPINAGKATATTPRSTVSELDRTVQVRWPKETTGAPLEAKDIKSLFSIFGHIESADMLTPKMLRIGPKRKKQLVATCMVQYSSVVGAHSAVEDFKKQSGPEWSRFDSVFWAANKEPDFISHTNHQPPYSTPSTPNSRHGVLSSPKQPISAGRENDPPSTRLEGENVLKKTPSFASFSSAILNSPSLEEITMIRLRNAQKQRLANDIQRQDEEATATAAAAAAQQE